VLHGIRGVASGEQGGGGSVTGADLKGDAKEQKKVVRFSVQEKRIWKWLICETEKQKNKINVFHRAPETHAMLLHGIMLGHPWCPMVMEFPTPTLLEGAHRTEGHYLTIVPYFLGT